MKTISVCRIPDKITVEFDNGQKTASPMHGEVVFDDVRVGWAEGVPTLQADTSSVRLVILRWNGEMDKECLYLGDAVERAYGHLGWQYLSPHRLMPWYFVQTDKDVSKGFGVATGGNSFAYWMADPQGITLILDVRCGGEGVILRGRNLALAKVLELESAEGENTFRFMQRFCKAMCPRPLLPKEPVYGSNNWYYAYGVSSAKEILEDTALVAELTEGIENRPYMVIDDCWQPLARTTGAAGRPMDRGNEHFPDMAELARQMQALGVKPGIWMRPTRTAETDLPPHLYSDRDKNYLDLSEPEALELVAKDVERVVSWGYTLIKYDFATFDVFGCWGNNEANFIMQMPHGWRWHRTDKTNAEVIRQYYQTIYDHAHHAVLIGCNVVGHLAAGLIHVHRSGDDTSGRNWGRTAYMGVNALAFRLAQNNAFFKIDADCVGVTTAVDWQMNRQFLDLVSRSGSPLFCSMAKEALNENIKDEIREAFRRNAIQNDTLEPMDWFRTSCPEVYQTNGEIKQYHWVPAYGFTYVEQ